MMGQPLRVLIVDDSAEDAELMVRALERGGRSVAHERVQTEAALASALAKPQWDVVLSDYTLARCSALAALAVLKATDVDLPFIVVSGTIGEETAVAAMKAGAPSRRGPVTPASNSACTSSCARPRRRKPWGSSPAVWRTTSTIC